jgi:hypothetical protein
MTVETKDLVRVASGELVQIELYQQALADAAIDCQVVGGELDSSFGTAIPQSMELWVREEDAEKARAAIARLESERGRAPLEREEA